jgi:hypothetical protein
MLGNYRVVYQLVASGVMLSSMELVTYLSASHRFHKRDPDDRVMAFFFDFDWRFCWS